jgi:PBP1b-binding outer membrane lipoprotein LpoB
MKQYLFLLFFCFFIVGCSKETPPEIIENASGSVQAQIHT